MAWARRLFWLLGVVLAHVAFAHDVPDDVRVLAFVKPEGTTLRLVARVPMKALRDVDVPRRSDGMLDFARVDDALRDAATLWLGNEIELYEDGVRLEKPRVVDTRVSFESDRSFASYDEALAHFNAPRPGNDTALYWNQGLMDVVLDYAIRTDRAEFAIRPNLERLGIRVNIVLRFLPPGGDVRAFDLHGDPGLVRLDPRWYQAAATFVKAGFQHILDGTDHLLFVALLVVPFRRIVPLAALVTAFTVAHSITLVATGLGYGPQALWFAPLIETLIAASILYMAIENVTGAHLRRRWVLAFAFGLVHGFGFAFGLQQLMQFAGTHLITSLIAFNVGVELGQLLVIVVLVPLLRLLFDHVRERVATLVLSALIGHTAWHWLVERYEKLAKFPWPEIDAASVAALLRWVMLLVAIAVVAWLGAGALRRRWR